MWCDFIPMLGTDYNGMKAFMGDTPKKTSADGLWFGFPRSVSALQKISEVTAVLDSKSKKVIEIMLDFPEVVTSTELETYLKSRFFESSVLGEGFYTNKSDVEKSTVILYYDKSANVEHDYMSVVDYERDWKQILSLLHKDNYAELIPLLEAYVQISGKHQSAADSLLQRCQGRANATLKR